MSTLHGSNDLGITRRPRGLGTGYLPVRQGFPGIASLSTHRYFFLAFFFAAAFFFGAFFFGAAFFPFGMSVLLDTGASPRDVPGMSFDCGCYSNRLNDQKYHEPRECNT